jgi:hypothetical protein
MEVREVTVFHRVTTLTVDSNGEFGVVEVGEFDEDTGACVGEGF